MGTTSEKLTYLNVTKQKLKQAINNIGGEVTDETTFREYVDQLQNAYDNLPKTEYQEGTEVNLGKTIKGKLDFKKEYQEVEYIECDGGQHIDTGYIPNYNTKIEAEFAHNEYTKDTPLFGARDANYSKAYIFWSHPIEYDNNHQSTAQFNSTTTAMNNFTVGTKIKVVYNNQRVIYGGVNYTWPSETTQGSPNLSLILLGLSNGGNIDGRKFSGKLWYFKIWDGDVLVRDFIPCYRISDGEVGLYDKVQGKFYTKLGSGTLTKGADVGNGFIDIAGIGQTKQDSTTGTQRMDTTEYIPETTSKGVTYSLKDGVFTFNGTATGSLDVYCQNKVTLEAGTYTIAPSDESGSYTGVFGKYAYVSGLGNIIDGGQVRQLVTKTIESDYTNVQCHLYVASGAVFSNYKFKVNLVKGTYTAQTIPAWEQYTGGYSSPSPNWKQQVKCVAGRNKLPTHEIKKFTASADAWCSLDGISNFYNQTNIAPSKVFCNLKANQTYTISVYQKANTNNVQLVDYTGAVLLTGLETQAKQYTPSTDIKVYPRLKVTNSNTETYCYMQIEEGSQATPYLPYNTIEEVVSGINYANYSLLFNNTDCYSISNDNISLLQNDSRATTLIDGTTWGISLKKGTYTLYTSGTGISPQIQIIGKVIGQIARVNYSQLVTFNLSQDDIVAIKYLNTASFPINLGKVMIIEGTIANTPTYEPYITPKTYQFSLGDRKVFEGDYFWRDNNGKFYHHHKMNYELIKDTTVERATTSTSGKYKFKITPTLLVKPVVSTADVGNAISNILSKKSANSVHLCQNGIAVTTTGALFIYHEDFSEYTGDQMRTYFNNHNDYIVYQLATETDEEITGTLAEQLEAWYNAHSNNGTTIITSNGDLPMIIKVRGLKGE